MWTKFADKMPDAHRPILIAWADRVPNSSRPDQYWWAVHTDYAFVKPMGFGHAVFKTDADGSLANQLSDCEHDGLLESGMWAYLSDLIPARAIAESIVATYADEVADVFFNGETLQDASTVWGETFEP